MEATVDRGWRKSSYSGNGGQCVEVADRDNHLLVRDSKEPEGAKLAFTTASWTAFTAKVKASLADPAADPVGAFSCLEVPLRRVRGRFRPPPVSRRPLASLWCAGHPRGWRGPSLWRP